MLDTTHVRSGPPATRLPAWPGADGVKPEAPGGGITRGQLRDLPGVDSLYFTMLDANKRSITRPRAAPAAGNVTGGAPP